MNNIYKQFFPIRHRRELERFYDYIIAYRIITIQIHTWLASEEYWQKGQ